MSLNSSILSSSAPVRALPSRSLVIIRMFDLAQVDLVNTFFVAPLGSAKFKYCVYYFCLEII